MSFEQIGTCDHCSTPGIPLVDYQGRKVCKACYEELTDLNSPVLRRMEEGYQDLLRIFESEVEDG